MTTAAAPITIERAIAHVAAHAAPLAHESVALEDAYGRFLATDVHAPIALPSFPNSAMDGFAVHADEAPGTLRIIGESAAGVPFAGVVGAGEAVAISTGAVVPNGTDGIAPVEIASVSGDQVRINASVTRGEYLRAQGSDVQAGDLLLCAGTRIGPAQVGALAAVGLNAVTCHRRPRVAVLATGSELREPGQPLDPGEIYNSNGPMLRVALRSAGVNVTEIPVAVDTVAAHREALVRALEHDAVISTGGVSVGPHDLVREVERQLGVTEVFWRVAMRPGKPVTFGTRGRSLVFGLPGNPVSTLVCFELFVRPALMALQGDRRGNPGVSHRAARHIRRAQYRTGRPGPRPGRRRGAWKGRCRASA